VLAGKSKGYASFVPLAEAGAVDDEVAREVFLGWDGALEPSPTRFVPMVRMQSRVGLRSRCRGIREGEISLSTTFNLNNAG